MSIAQVSQKLQVTVDVQICFLEMSTVMKIVRNYAISFIVLCVLSLQTKLHALGLGLVGGLDLAKFTVNGGSSGNNAGFLFGVYTDIGLPVPLLFIQPELYFIQKGGNTSDGELIYNYLEAPVFAKVKTPVSSTLSFFALLGPNISFLTGTSLGSSRFNRVDVGLIFGGGMGYKMLSVFELSLALRYGIGFLDSTTNTEMNKTSNKHRNLEIVITYGKKI